MAKEEEAKECAASKVVSEFEEERIRRKAAQDIKDKEFFDLLKVSVKALARPLTLSLPFPFFPSPLLI